MALICYTNNDIVIIYHNPGQCDRSGDFINCSNSPSDTCQLPPGDIQGCRCDYPAIDLGGCGTDIDICLNESADCGIAISDQGFASLGCPPDWTIQPGSPCNIYTVETPICGILSAVDVCELSEVPDCGRAEVCLTEVCGATYVENCVPLKNEDCSMSYLYEYCGASEICNFAGLGSDMCVESEMA